MANNDFKASDFVDGYGGAAGGSTIDATGISTEGALTVDGNTTLGGDLTVDDDGFTIQDNLDNTKKIAFQASGITTATTRTLTAPDQDGTIVTEDGSGDVSITNDLSVGGTQEIGATGYGASTDADDLVIGSGAGATAGITLHTNNGGRPSIFFADIGSNAIGRLVFQHSNNELETWVAGSVEHVVGDGYMIPPTAASAPGSPVEGWIYYDTTLNEPRVYDGSQWRAMEGSGPPAWGKLYYSDTTTPATVTISTAGTPVKFSAFSTAGDDGTVVDANTTDDDMTIQTNGDGDYNISWNASYTLASGGGTRDTEVAIFINGVEDAGTLAARSVTAGSYASVSGGDIVTLSSGDDIDLRFTNLDTNTNIEVAIVSLRIERV